ncbi:MAG TPA: hypothetical protein VIH47_00330 [Solirubrobacterales bacterium]
MALAGLSGVASANPNTPETFPTEACPVHGHIELNVSYSCTAEFTLSASNGYRITVSADPTTGGRRFHRFVHLTAKGHGGTAEYNVHGIVTPTTIKADFGHLGKISVGFEPSGRQRNVRVPKKCMKERPRVVTSRLGKFVGTIKFRGERGYTRVSAHSATGGTGDPLANTPKKLQCDFHESDAEHKRELESVSLDGSPPNSQISFSAFHLFGDLPASTASGKALPPKGDRYLFLVFAGEKVGKMSILRSTGALGTSKDFVFDKTLSSATVRPPFPFTGSGSFLRKADGSTSWTGNLAAPLPGLGTVSLTGGKADLATVAAKANQFEEELEK